MWKPFKSYEEQAQYILEHNKYMVVATSTKSGKPWASPVFYAHDDNFNFYFLSAIDSLHAKNLVENPDVALVIYDSKQPIGFAEQIQVLGKATVLDLKEVGKAIEVYCEKLFPNSKINPLERYRPGDYSGASEFRFFKIVPTKFYTTGPERREEVHLTKHK